MVSAAIAVTKSPRYDQAMKKCRICGDRFEPRYTSFQKTCDTTSCILEFGRLEKTKREQKAKKAERQKFLDGDKSHWKRKAQIEFNKWIRHRDKGQPCISCQKQIKGQSTAGHYKSVGAFPELRFDEANVHLQCGQCNTFKSGNLLEYRPNLIAKIGLEEVERLEGPHQPKQYSLDELKAVHAEYKARNDGQRDKHRPRRGKLSPHP